MSSKFKVGDLVVVTKLDDEFGFFEDPKKWEGKIFKVVKIYADQPYSVQLGPYESQTFAERELRAATKLDKVLL